MTAVTIFNIFGVAFLAGCVGGFLSFYALFGKVLRISKSIRAVSAQFEAWSLRQDPPFLHVVSGDEPPRAA